MTRADNSLYAGGTILELAPPHEESTEGPSWRPAVRARRLVTGMIAGNVPTLPRIMRLAACRADAEAALVEAAEILFVAFAKKRRDGSELVPTGAMVGEILSYEPSVIDMLRLLRAIHPEFTSGEGNKNDNTVPGMIAALTRRPMILASQVALAGAGLFADVATGRFEPVVVGATLRWPGQPEARLAGIAALLAQARRGRLAARFEFRNGNGKVRT